MFRGAFAEGKLLKTAIDAISKLITEGTFSVDENGMKLVALDPAKVAMIDLNVLPTGFIEYHVDSPIKFTVDIDYFSKVLKRAKARTEIEMVVGDDLSRLEIVLKNGYKRKFFIPLIQPSEEEEAPQPSGLEFKGRLEIEAGFVKDAIKDAKMISDAVKFIADPDIFKIVAKSEAGEVSAEVSKSDPALLEIDVPEHIEATYTIEYLEKIIKAEGIADTVSIEFGNNYPVRITYKSLDRLKLAFILAPRLE